MFFVFLGESADGVEREAAQSSIPSITITEASGNVTAATGTDDDMVDDASTQDLGVVHRNLEKHFLLKKSTPNSLIFSNKNKIISRTNLFYNLKWIYFYSSSGTTTVGKLNKWK